MEITFLELMVFGLASFRLTRLLVYDKITAFLRDLFIKEIEEIDENGEKSIYLVPKDGWFREFFGELLSCYWCTGIWSSIALYTLYCLLPSIAVPLLFVLAISGIAAIIESILQIWI
jgi:hypothetical protein